MNSYKIFIQLSFFTSFYLIQKYSYNNKTIISVSLYHHFMLAWYSSISYRIHKLSSDIWSCSSE